MSETKQTNREPTVDTERLIRFLKDRESYPHRVERVDLVQTHISCVAMAGDFVYKVKKPVDLGFLDYSTLDRRRHFAQREIELNRRLCSRIYLDVVNIIDRDGHLQFGDGGDEDHVVDCAVKMRRLDERCFLSHRLEHRQACGADIDRIIEVLTPFYREQEPTADVLDNGKPEQVFSVIEANLDDAEEEVGQVLSRFAYDALQRFNHLWFRHYRGLLQQRVERRRIKDGHGDLRPDHIHLGPDSICIYDCIEFNDSFRHVDVAADCAFLAMELDRAGRPDLSRRFVDGISDALDDPDVHRLMDVYECHRAMVRARVEYLRNQEEEVADTQREASLARAKTYARLALEYAIAPSRPMVLAIMGRIGTGKSRVAEGLAEALGWPVLSSDRIRKQMAGLPLHGRTPADARDRLYDPEMSDHVYGRIFEQALEHAGRRESVILDATFGRHVVRDGLRDELDRRQIDYRFVELTAADEIIRKRLDDRADQTNVISDARREDFTRLASAYEPPADPVADPVERISTEQPLEETLRDICMRLIASRMDSP